MAAIVHFVCLHSRTLKEAAHILEMDEKTLRKLRRELGVEWTRPMKRFAPTSSPPEWWRELMQFLRSASRAGRPIELPDELLIQWWGSVRSCGGNWRRRSSRCARSGAGRRW